MVRGAIDRFLVGLALLVLRGFFRTVEVEGRERIPAGRPVLVVANHFNGFVDAALLVHVFGRVPRFLAKATLWRKRWVRPLLALGGVVPLHRPQDDPGQRGDNQVAFAHSAQLLSRRRGLVAIFPEGMTHDTPALAPIRTGAARLALGTRAAGAKGLLIVPVGMAFDDKLALRSRALARIGEPIDLDAEIGFVTGDGPEDDTNREAVRRLTAEIEHRLRAVSPDYRDERQARVLTRAAEIAQRTSRGHVTLAQQEALAQRLAYAPQQVLEGLMDALARYHLHLELVGLRDHQLVQGYTAPQLLVGFLKTAAIVTLIAPFALVGTVVNLVPYWCVVAAGRAVARPVMKGTARVLAGLAVFPLVWAGVILGFGRTNPPYVTAQLVLFIVCGLVAVAFFERIERARRAFRGWQALRDRRALLDDVRADRRRLVDAVEAAAKAAPPEPVRAAG